MVVRDNAALLHAQFGGFWELIYILSSIKPFELPYLVFV